MSYQSVSVGHCMVLHKAIGNGLRHSSLARKRSDLSGCLKGLHVDAYSRLSCQAPAQITKCIAPGSLARQPQPGGGRIQISSRVSFLSSRKHSDMARERPVEKITKRSQSHRNRTSMSPLAKSTLHQPVYHLPKWNIFRDLLLIFGVFVRPRISSQAVRCNDVTTIVL